MRSRIGISVVAGLLLWTSVASAAVVDFTAECTQVVLGPITLLDTTGIGLGGTLDLTPNVAAAGEVVINQPFIFQQNSNAVMSGTFMGTLSCTLTMDGVMVAYTRPLTLAISTSSPCGTPGVAAGCLTIGAPSPALTVSLGARGTVHVTAPSRMTLGYDSQFANGFLVIVLGTLSDTALLECTVANGCAEVCDDCIDDNGDGLVDRDDPDCEARANGNGAGLGPVKPRGQAIVKCGKAIQKSGAKLAGARLKHLQKCVGAVLKCVQTKPDDQACLTKSTATCTKELGALTKDRTKATATIGKACAPLAGDDDALFTSAGLGFGAESDVCEAHGVPSLTTLDDVAACVANVQQCEAELALGFEMPRAAELLDEAGFDPETVASCLPIASGTLGDGIADTDAAKAVTSCGQAIAKGGAKFLSAKQALVQKCANAVTVCVQQKPDDSGCLDKARAGCAKAVAKIAAAEAKLQAGIVAKCGAIPANDLLQVAGLGYRDRAGACTALGGNLTDAASVGACVVRQHECRAEQLLEAQVPRLHELLDLGDVTLP